MKKSIVYLGLALIAFTNVSLASTSTSFSNEKQEFLTYNTPSPLDIAISKGDIESVKKFIEYGVDVNELSNGLSPLMLAARYNKVEIMKILIANGARINAKSENGLTALKYAKLSNATEAFLYLKQMS
jgi:ankyrin repeat protein